MKIDLQAQELVDTLRVKVSCKGSDGIFWDWKAHLFCRTLFQAVGKIFQGITISVFLMENTLDVSMEMRHLKKQIFFFFLMGIPTVLKMGTVLSCFTAVHIWAYLCFEYFSVAILLLWPEMYRMSMKDFCVL